MARKDQEPLTIGGYPVVGEVAFTPEQKKSLERRNDDPLFVTVEGVKARAAANMGRHKATGDMMVKFYDSEENAINPSLHLMDPIVRIPADQVDKKVKKA